MRDRSGLWGGDKHHMWQWGDESLKEFKFQKHTSNFHSGFTICTTNLFQFLQKDKPAFQDQLVESYPIKKNFVQSLQEIQIFDFHCQFIYLFNTLETL